MIPTAGFLSDVAVIIFLLQVRSGKSFEKPLLLFYFCLANWNLGFAFLCIADSIPNAKLTLYLMHHAHLFISSSFLWLGISLSGRELNKLRNFAFFLSFLVLILVEYSFWFTPDDTFFISTIKKYSWGFYPLSGIGSLFHDVLFLICIPVSFYFLFNPLKIVISNYNLIRNLLVVLWLIAIFSFLPLHGYQIYPLGNAADAIVSVFIIFVLYKDSKITGKDDTILRISGLLASLSLGLIVAYLFSELLTKNSFFPLVASIGSSITSIFVFQKLFPISQSSSEILESEKMQSISGLLQSKFSLTDQESIICILLHKGSSRKEIVDILDIKETTIKTHLKSIYKKTIEQENYKSSNEREKLQRLTVLLNTISRNQNLKF